MDDRLLANVSPIVGAKAVTDSGAGSGAICLVPKPCLLFSLFGTNSTTIQLYIQLFDKAVAPVNGDVPIANVAFLIGSGVTLTLSGLFPHIGLYFANGLAFGLSTTKATFTANATNQTLYTFSFSYRD